MNISNRSYPMLEKIQKGDLAARNRIRYFVEDSDAINEESYQSLCSEWKTHCLYFKNEINYVCDSFLEAYHKEDNKIRAMILDYIRSNRYDPSDPRNVVACTFIIKDHVYNVHFEQKNNSVTGVLFGFNKEGAPWYYLKIENLKFVQEWCSKNVANPPDPNDVFYYIWDLAVMKKFGDVSIIEAQPHKKIVKDGMKKVNNTSQKICFLDKTWFNDIVRSESFSVREHQRNQPYGKGRTKIRQVTIFKYRKSGYTIHARKNKLKIKNKL